MRTLICVTAVCMAVVIAGLLWGKQPVHQSVDSVALLIKEHELVVVNTQKPLRPIVTDADELLLEEIVASEMLRLGAFKFQFQKMRNEIFRFIEFVKLVESNGEQYAQSQISSAMSLFQFTIPSVPTAVNRLENYMRRNYLGPVPEWAEMLRDDPKRLFDVSETRQSILTLVNIVEQRGSDELLTRYLSGERESAKALYYTFHHTDPDRATRTRVQKIFARTFE